MASNPITVKILVSVAGWFEPMGMYAYPKGAEVSLPARLAKDLIQAGHAEAVNPVKAKTPKKAPAPATKA